MRVLLDHRVNFKLFPVNLDYVVMLLTPESAANCFSWKKIT